MDQTNTANTMVEKFSQIIIRAAKEAIGLTTAQKEKKLVPWWNDQCKETKKLAKHAFNRYKKYKSVENMIIYKKKLELSLEKPSKKARKITGTKNLYQL